MENTEKKIPQWLKDLQENSWELELLISGGAIFSLFQLSSLYLNWIENISMISIIPGKSILLLMGMIGIKILTLGFIIHLSLRAYWLALVCINFVYPAGINTEKIKWKKPFKLKINKGDDLQDQITSVDKQCGTVMYMSIISVFVLVGNLLLFFFLVGIATLVFPSNPLFTVYISPMLFIILMIYVFDLLSFGFLRKIPFLSYLIFPVFKIFDLISLRPFYTKSLFIFNTNVVKWKFIIAAFIFLVVSITLAYLSTYKTMHWPNLFDQREFRWQMSMNEYVYSGAYMDEWDNEKFYKMGISSKIQTGNFMELFITYHKGYDHLIEKSSTVDSLKTFDKVVTVKIDTVVLKNLIWHPASKQSNLIGIIAMVPIHELANGKHILSVYSEGNNDPNHDQIYNATIPFWIDKKNIVQEIN